MYRPNRIGPWKLGNLNKPVLISTITDFATEEFAWASYKTNSLNVVSGIDIATEHIIFDQAALHLSAFSAVGFGVQVSGVMSENNYIYGIGGSITVNNATNDTDMEIECVLGRLAAPPAGIGSAPISVPSPIVVPCRRYIQDGPIIGADVNTQIVTQLQDGGTPVAEQPICLFWRLVNAKGVDITTSHIHMNLALHRYADDLDNFDPPRY